MTLIAVTGILNGVGVSTVTANLCCSLSELGKKVILVDLDKRNLSSYLLGNPMDNYDGWAYRRANSQDWVDAYYQSPQDLPFIPFGDPFYGLEDDHVVFSSEAACTQEQLFSLDDPFFDDMLDELNQQFDYIVLAMPCPTFNRNSPKFFRAINDKVDLHLMIINPESLSYSLLTNRLQLEKLNNTKLVLNNYALYSQLHSDFVLLFREEMPEKLISPIIHQDMVMLEACAKMTTVRHYSPMSQAVQDFKILALWLVAYVSGANG